MVITEKRETFAVVQFEIFAGDIRRVVFTIAKFEVMKLGKINCFVYTVEPKELVEDGGCDILGCLSRPC